jgi:shikimate kinase
MSAHVFLVGFMGAGKTTVSRLVAAELDRTCVDLDDRIEALAQRKVRAIFEDEGEAYFRQLETDALLALEDEPASIVACGGGVVISAENRAALKRMGLVVYLQVSAGETIARVGATTSRPLLAGPGGALAATKLLEARESLYVAVADVTIDTVGLSPAQVALQVSTAIEELGA